MVIGYMKAMSKPLAFVNGLIISLGLKTWDALSEAN
jgi:hypothetical protein